MSNLIQQVSQAPDTYEVACAGNTHYLVKDGYLIARVKNPGDNKYTLLANFTARVIQSYRGWLEIEVTHHSGRKRTISVRKKEFPRLGWVLKAGSDHIVEANRWAATKKAIKAMSEVEL